MGSELGRRGYLGFRVQARPGPAGSSREHWIVSEVDPGSPAALAGLALEDEVVSIDGADLVSLAMLRERVARVSPASGAVLGIVRRGVELDLPVVAAPMPLETLVSGSVELAEVPWTFQNQRYRLRAIWTLPSGPAEAALWLLPSAAWVSQECPLTPEDPTFQLIRELTALGIATLRVDRSGLGDSEGPPTRELDLGAELSMWAAAREHFLTRPQLAEVPRFVFGRSLGGMLAPLLLQGPFAGALVWGTSSEPWHEASLRSTERQAQLAGMSAEKLARRMKLYRRMQELVYLEGRTPDEARRIAPELGSELQEHYSGTQAHDRNFRFFYQLQRADVAVAWTRVEVPVLAIHAEYDILTQASDLRRIVDQVGPRARFLSVPGVDHFMHARESFAEAVRVPWGGHYSPEATRVVYEFLTSP